MSPPIWNGAVLCALTAERLAEAAPETMQHQGEGPMPSERSEDPTYRPLRVYAFDPSKGRNLNNYMTVQVPYEKLTSGPSGEYVTVIDYDGSNDVYYESVDLDS